MCFNVILFICLVYGCVIENVKGTTSSAIPDLLYNCYRNNVTDTTKNFKPPFTISLLIELIRKIESDDVNAFNMRILTTSMLHSVKFDGVRSTPSFSDDSLAIPFRANGEEFFKYRLIVDYLTAGESSLFPTDSLTTPELCFLHEMISNTVDPWERGDESSTCMHQPSMPLSSFEIIEDDVDIKISACPIKKGIVKTKWGPVSAGHIIAAVAAALQESQATFARIQSAINIEENKNSSENVPPTVTTNTNNVNNVWVSTLAGDFAHAILSQAKTTFDGSLDGFWNDTLLPRVYFLKSSNWELTEGEILGSIDALAMASSVKNSPLSTRVRLSQLIDMYYSERGIGTDKQYKATNRLTTLPRLLDGINLEEQVAGTAFLLQKIGTYNIFRSEDQINQLVANVTTKMRDVVGNITKTYDNVEYIDGKQMKSPVEIVMILDGSYDSYTAQQMLYALAEAAQVSHYGSKVGVINGQSGNWMVNVTGELFQLSTDLQRAQNEWPATLSLGRSLETLLLYYHNKSREDCLKTLAKPAGKVILIACPKSRLTDNDLVTSKASLNSLKNSYPEIQIIYVTDNNASVTALTQNFRDSDYVLNPSDNILSFVEHVSDILSNIPGNIINFYCDQSQVRLEDYITPGIETFYQICSEYIERSHVITNFSNSNYGDLTICAIVDYTKKEVCKEVTVHGEISFDSGELCASNSACNLIFRVSSNTTNVLCYENDCRYPDQVRLNIMSYKSSGYVPVLQVWYCIVITLTCFMALVL